jgi:hypothetical protein
VDGVYFPTTGYGYRMGDEVIYMGPDDNGTQFTFLVKGEKLLLSRYMYLKSVTGQSMSVSVLVHFEK